MARVQSLLLLNDTWCGLERVELTSNMQAPFGLMTEMQTRAQPEKREEKHKVEQ